MYLHVSVAGQLWISFTDEEYWLFQNSDMFWKPTIAVEGDVASFIVQISQGLKGYKCDPDWIQALKDKDQTKEKANM